MALFSLIYSGLVIESVIKRRRRKTPKQTTIDSSQISSSANTQNKTKRNATIKKKTTTQQSNNVKEKKNMLIGLIDRKTITFEANRYAHRTAYAHHRTYKITQFQKLKTSEMTNLPYIFLFPLCICDVWSIGPTICFFSSSSRVCVCVWMGFRNVNETK